MTYTNWLPGRKDNHDSHYEEDCVEFIPYRNHGAWDDLPCADYPDDDHDKDWGFTKYFICEHGKSLPSRKHAYIILTPLNPTFI